MLAASALNETQNGGAGTVEPSDPASDRSLYCMVNHRNDEQLAEMRRLEQEGACLFCPGELVKRAGNPIIHSTDWWTVTDNRYPYRHTRIHLLLIPSVHVADIAELPIAAKAEFWDVLDWARVHYELDFYGLGVRCGDCAFTGGTIRHVHLHLIVGDVEDPGHEPVRMKLSSRPT